MARGLVLVVVEALIEFFPEDHVRSNFLCNLGYCDRAKLFPRSPRLEFDEACLLLYEHSSLPGADWTISGSRAAASLGQVVARSQPR